MLAMSKSALAFGPRRRLATLRKNAGDISALHVSSPSIYMRIAFSNSFSTDSCLKLSLLSLYIGSIKPSNFPPTLLATGTAAQLATRGCVTHN